MAINTLFDSLSNNPYFGAGFGLVGVGAGLAALRRGFVVGTIIFQRHMMTTLEVPCRDKSYQWLLQYITKNAQNTQHLSVETTFEQLETGKIRTKFDFVPSVGKHFFNYKGSWVQVERNREQSTIDLQMGIPFETVKLTTIGRNKNLFKDMLDRATTDALSSYEGKTVMYVGMGHEWRQFGHPRKRRPISSVVLDDGVAERILTDIKEFIDSASWYARRGIPYRRGYLLHGPPGCGKTSYITALAGELEYSICVLNLSERGLTDDRLNHLMSMAPTQSLILLEDIDAAFISREDTAQQKAAYDGLNRVTFSGLLNMLDGVASTEARIVFMTTNFLERLDPALIRPGRVDVKEYIGYVSNSQIRRAFSNFYPEATQSTIEEFVNSVQSHKKPLSMAMLQGFFLIHKDNPSQALINVEKVWNL